MDNPIRWKQRFENFEKANAQLGMILGRKEFGDIEKMALIQAFEFTYELAWKTMKDYLEEEGYDLDSPKSVIRQAFQSQLISDAEVWMEALKRRNNTVHNYNPQLMEESVAFIRDQFAPSLAAWHQAMRNAGSK